MTPDTSPIPVRERTRREIVQAAMHLFATKGYEATSLQDIATTVGCSKGVVSYHFSGKRALFAEVIAPGVDALRALVGDVADLPATRAQAEVVPRFITLCLEFRGVVAVLPEFTASSIELDELGELNLLGGELLRLLAGSEDPTALEIARFALAGLFVLTREPRAPGGPSLRAVLETAFQRLLGTSGSPTA